MLDTTFLEGDEIFKGVRALSGFRPTKAGFGLETIVLVFPSPNILGSCFGAFLVIFDAALLGPLTAGTGFWGSDGVGESLTLFLLSRSTNVPAIVSLVAATFWGFFLGVAFDG